MSRQSQRARTQAVIPLLFAILVAAVLPHHLLSLVCRSGAVMQLDACCPSLAVADEPAPTSGADGAAWRDEACCSLRTAHLEQGTPEHGVRAVSLVDVPATLPVVDVSSPVFVSARPLAAPRAAWPPGPSLLLRKHAFLL